MQSPLNLYLPLPHINQSTLHMMKENAQQEVQELEATWLRQFPHIDRSIIEQIQEYVRKLESLVHTDENYYISKREALNDLFHKAYLLSIEREHQRRYDSRQQRWLYKDQTKRLADNRDQKRLSSSQTSTTTVINNEPSSHTSTMTPLNNNVESWLDETAREAPSIRKTSEAKATRRKGRPQSNRRITRAQTRTTQQAGQKPPTSGPPIIAGRITRSQTNKIRSRPRLA